MSGPSRDLGRLLLLAALLRLVVALTALGDPTIPVKPDDYLRIATTWLETGRYVETHFPPVYPGLCALAVWLAGSAAGTVVLLTQLLAGVAAVAMTYHLAASLGAGPRARGLAAGLVAVDPLSVVIGGFFLTEATYTLLLLATLCALVRVGPSSSLAASLGLGVLLGITALTRSIGIALVAPVLWWLVRSHRAARGRAAIAAAVMLSGLLLALAPWSLHNHRHFGTLRLTSSASHNLAALVIGPARARHEGRGDTGQTVWQTELAELPPHQVKSPFARADQLRDIAVAWARDNPAPVLTALVVSQGRLWLGPGRNFFAALLGVPLDRLPRSLLAYLVAWRAALAIAFGVALALMIGSRRHRATILLAVAVIACHALPIGAAGYSRYMVPMVPLIAITIALGLVQRPLLDRDAMAQGEKL